MKLCPLLPLINGNTAVGEEFDRAMRASCTRVNDPPQQKYPQVQGQISNVHKGQ